ncbi:hypothetical protein [Paracoccus tibetensis]|uniref:Uncharacterized protein n=1 Tax=Paracoccus tibetensis TaxID=336292 RepID=A0A1G5BBD7_9RHOB|nr:hypothetical protein [Paracoccus tibetensis]SCX87436.1 hypothetical protein SAMN05660710_00073 [Paracoccus tibetensis]
MNAILRQALSIQPQEAPQAPALSDLIPARARALGCIDFEDYCDLIDREATAHLSGANLVRISRLRQQRRPRAFFDRNYGLHGLSVCLNRNRTMFAKVDAADWIEMQEMGANGLWQGLDTFYGIYVYTALPLKRQAATEKVPTARLILDLKPHEQVRFLDGDPLNLRRYNLAVSEQSSIGRPARHDARQVAQEAAAHRTEMVSSRRTFDALR